MVSSAFSQIPFMAKKPRREIEDTPVRRWLRSIRAAYGYEQADLAHELGVSRSAVGMYETGHPLPTEMVATLQERFPDVPKPLGVADVPSLVEEIRPILGNATYLEAVPYAEIRYAGEVPASNWGNPLSADTTTKVEAKFAGPGRFECKVVGDSCYPALKQGDRTIWESDHNPPYRKIVIAERSDDDACTVKQFTYSARDGKPSLRPVNPRYDPPENGNGWRVTARLVGVIRMQNGAERTWYKPEGLEPRDLFDFEEELEVINDKAF